MKIGIITYHAAHNYGAVLQAYALQTELQRMGHEPRFIHFYPDDMEARNRYRRPVKSAKDLAGFLAHGLLRSRLERRFERFNRFRDERLLLSRRYRSYEELVEDPPEFDAYICGSDQIWNFGHGASPVNFLRFIDPARLAVAYAPSFGSNYGVKDAPAELAGWLNRFQHLSAREASGKNLMEELTGRDVPQVVDPTFLLESSEWEGLLSPAQSDPPYMLFYALETTRLSSAVIRSMVKRTRLPIVVVGKGGISVVRRGTKLAIDSGPSEFLGLIRHASLVVTNSFHASIFSILFGIPFITIGHSTRNARMESLLSAHGLGDRLVSSLDAIERLDDALLCTSATSAPWREEIGDSRGYLLSSLRQASTQSPISRE